MPAPPAQASTSAVAAAPATTTASMPSSAAPPLANGSSQLHPELQRPAQPVREFGFAQCSGREALPKIGERQRADQRFVDDGLNACVDDDAFLSLRLASPSPLSSASLSLPPQTIPFSSLPRRRRWQRCSPECATHSWSRTRRCQTARWSTRAKGKEAMMISFVFSFSTSFFLPPRKPCFPQRPFPPAPSLPLSLSFLTPPPHHHTYLTKTRAASSR